MPVAAYEWFAPATRSRHDGDSDGGEDDDRDDDREGRKARIIFTDGLREAGSG